MTAVGNLGIGAAEIVAGGTSTLSVLGDGVHNVGDVTYAIQAEAVINPGMPEERRVRLREIAHTIISLMSLGVSAKAGMDLALGNEGDPDPFAPYAAGLSLSFNGLLYWRLRRGIQRAKQADDRSHTTAGERDLIKHFLAVDMPSAALAVLGVAAQGASTAAEQVAAVASGLIGAYVFRPTEANLAHDHSHSHDHHDHAHGEHSEYAHKSWLSRMKRNPTHQKGWLERMAYQSRHSASSNIDLPPLHPWTYHPTNYKRDILKHIKQKGERLGIASSLRTVGHLLVDQFIPPKAHSTVARSY